MKTVYKYENDDVFVYLNYFIVIYTQIELSDINIFEYFIHLNHQINDLYGVIKERLNTL